MMTEERADHYLTSLERWARELRLLAEVWESPDLDARERMAFQVEWDNVIDRLEKTEALSQHGTLSATTTARLRGIANDLAELVPTMHRLGLRCPDPDALARARIASAA